MNLNFKHEVLMLNSVSSKQSANAIPVNAGQMGSPKLYNLAKKMLFVALPLIMMANLPGAQGGPVTYAACMAGVAAFPALWATCIPFLAPWCP
jgi:hypothetical protein